MTDGSQSERPGDVLVVLAHPDDPEFFCGGTVARWTDEGRKVTFCLLTRGDKGADEPGADPVDLAERRVAEQVAAAQVLGVTDVRFLDYSDGEVVANAGLRRDVTRVVRQVRPEILVTSDPSNFYSGFINHADHRAVGEACLYAAWPAARSALYFPELYQEEQLQPHKVPFVYLAGAMHPDTVVDISDYIDRKLTALREHVSQVGEFQELEERLRERLRDPRSPPDSPRYIEQFKVIELRL